MAEMQHLYTLTAILTTIFLCSLIKKLIDKVIKLDSSVSYAEMNLMNLTVVLSAMFDVIQIIFYSQTIFFYCNMFMLLF